MTTPTPADLRREMQYIGAIDDLIRVVSVVGVAGHIHHIGWRYTRDAVVSLLNTKTNKRTEHMLRDIAARLD